MQGRMRVRKRDDARSPATTHHAYLAARKGAVLIVRDMVGFPLERDSDPHILPRYWAATSLDHLRHAILSADAAAARIPIASAR